MAQPGVGKVQPTVLRVPAEQDLGDRQANQLGVGEARWSTRAMTNEGRQEVVDFDVECHDEGVECCLHKLVFGPLALLVTACFRSVANLESII